MVSHIRGDNSNLTFVVVGRETTLGSELSESLAHHVLDGRGELIPLSQIKAAATVDRPVPQAGDDLVPLLLSHILGFSQVRSLPKLEVREPPS